MIYLCL